MATVALLASAISSPCATAACKLGRLAQLPVTMVGMQPQVQVRINGQPASLVIDSAAFYSLLSPAAAAQYGLRQRPLPTPLALEGFGGTAYPGVTTVKHFDLAGIVLDNIDFLVGGTDLGNGAAGVIGQNVLRVADVEYDLAHGMIQIMRTEGCQGSALAYWATSQPYSQISIEHTTALSPDAEGKVVINGVPIDAIFDTGLSTSIISLAAARKAGVPTSGLGVTPSGGLYGVSSRGERTWTAPVASFKIGDEEVRNTRLRIADFRDFARMWVGADFFLSHHIYVANSQHRLYLTYNGGPVFNLSVQPAKRAAPEQSGSAPIATAASGATAGKAGSLSAPADSVPAGSSSATPDSTSAGSSAVPAVARPEPAPEAGGAPASGAFEGVPDPNEPTTADAYSRRGSAFAARRDYDRALSDFTRACELAPDQPDYLIQRAAVRLQLKQTPAALSDLDHALTLKPDELRALVLRARIRLQAHDEQGAIADIDAASRAAAPQTQARLELSDLYVRVWRFESAIEQANLWIDSHPRDGLLGLALSVRCRARAYAGQDLDKALGDCNEALRGAGDHPKELVARGLIGLRQRKSDRSIADFNAAIRLAPRDSWALYGRGLAELRKGNTTQSQADIAAAVAISPHVEKQFERIGLTK